MSDYGIKVSLPGNSTATGAENLVMSSAYPNPKIKINQTPAHFNYNTYTYTANPPLGTTNLVTINHGLGYTPAILSTSSTDANIFRIGTFFTGGFGADIDYYHIYSTSTAFVIDIERVFFDGTRPNLSGTNFYYKYYIFVEDGA